jgi:glutamate synthase (ferredoxin)
VELSNPVLIGGELDALKAEESLNAATLSYSVVALACLLNITTCPLASSCSCILVAVSHKNHRLGQLQEPTKLAIPVLLVVGCRVQHHLILNGLHMSASMLADTAQCFSTHQFGYLIGYGARYLSYLVFYLMSCYSSFVYLMLSLQQR